MTRFTWLSSLVLSIAICSSGCVTEHRPKQWPKPVAASTKGCPDLSGSYNNHGSSVDDKWGASDLVKHLFSQAPKEHDRFTDVSHVIIYGPNKDGLVIEAWRGEDLIAKIERNHKIDQGFACENGTLIVSLPMGGISGPDVIGFDAFNMAVIMPATDGSIIVRSRSVGFALVFFGLPFAAKFESWELYPPFEPNKPDDKASDQGN